MRGDVGRQCQPGDQLSEPETSARYDDGYVLENENHWHDVSFLMKDKYKKNSTFLHLYFSCTNSTNPMQIRTQSMMNQQQMMQDRSVLGQYYTCVHDCMTQMPSGASTTRNGASGSCMQMLGCELDMSMINIDWIGTAAQDCNMMTMSASTPMNGQSSMMNQQQQMMNQQQMMMNQQQMNQQQMMMSMSPTMKWLGAQDCQCLANAGVQ